jgi:hypothetical protein
MDRAEPLQRDVLGRGRELSARVVHEDVDRAEPFPHGIEEPVDLVGLADVARARQDRSSGGLELGTDGLERLGSPSADRHRGARSRQFPRDGAADPGPATRHDRDRAFVGVGGEGRSEPVGHRRSMEHGGTGSGTRDRGGSA